MPDLEQSVVLHFRNGLTERALGVSDIAADASSIVVESDDGARRDVPLSELKAVFFLRPPTPDAAIPDESLEGSTLVVEFGDGEVIRGRALQYNPAHSGFLLFPADRSKNERVFVVNSAIVSIEVEKF